ncbi:hypothetical protein ElyMa_003868800 [Elysia marginata]|uniref:Uncharacterized protein n=1 Tax=Elysia marginata TaxID=1093978 RepID=A0AAV4FKG9_9GAST|nr:hypothetical protein ElyMa_003868800 [Elysia marginata]
MRSEGGGNMMLGFGKEQTQKSVIGVELGEARDTTRSQHRIVVCSSGSQTDDSGEHRPREMGGYLPSLLHKYMCGSSLIEDGGRQSENKRHGEKEMETAQNS